MDYITEKITEVDSLLFFGKLYKLRLKAIAAAISMTLFKVIDPQFITASGHHTTIDTELSYFIRITMYAK